LIKITPYNLIHHEIIGLEIEVAESTNSYLIGIKGKLIDETKNMLIIDTGKSLKKIPKSSSKFIFTLPDSLRVKVDGRLLLSQPENRIKTRFKKKFREVL